LISQPASIRSDAANTNSRVFVKKNDRAEVVVVVETALAPVNVIVPALHSLIGYRKEVRK
jgi:hypothetical protein